MRLIPTPSMEVRETRSIRDVRTAQTSLMGIDHRKETVHNDFYGKSLAHSIVKRGSLATRGKGNYGRPDYVCVCEEWNTHKPFFSLSSHTHTHSLDLSRLVLMTA